MRARDIIGKTVKAVKQSFHEPSGGGRAASINWIEFTDGSRLYFCALEMESAADYIVHGNFQRRAAPQPTEEKKA